MARLYHPLLCLLVVLGASILFFPMAKATTIAGCSKVESDALLTFKDGVTDPANRLSSWQGQVDCCRWSGVVCGNISSHVHVVELNLEDDDHFNDQTALAGQLLNPSLVSLTYLSRLNLSGNDFGGYQIPQLVGSFNSLRYLDLSRSSFGGTIPPQLGNLSTLLYLDLSPYLSNVATSLHTRVDSMEWLKQLTSLRYLKMNAVNLSAASHEWLRAVNMSHSLEALHLSNCDLTIFPSTLSFVNLTALEILDLAFNFFRSTLPTWLWEFSNLSYLDLHGNEFYGRIPAAIGNMTSLDTLILGMNNLDGGPILASITNLIHLNTFDFSYNNMSGGVPDWLMNMTNLTYLDLSFCSLNGSFPVDIGRLHNLVYLDLSSNSLQGTVSELHLANLTALETFYLSKNSLSISINEEWIPTLQLKHIGLSSCNLGAHFPRWLQRQRSIVSLDLSNTSIDEALPDWLWSLWPALVALDISYNKISGSLPESLEGMEELQVIIASSNKLQGRVPILPSSIRTLDLSNNSLSGSLPAALSVEQFSILLLANNQINGSMPSYFCNMTYLYFLDLSNNQIEGEIPPCWNSSMLIIMSLSNNNLSGSIPSFAVSKDLRYLNLNNNSLSGELPPSLQNCSFLTLLDLGENKLSGNIPIWIGVSLQILAILRLHSNTFSGSIPLQLGQLSNLHIVDLSDNQLSGFIPSSFGNFSAMISTSEYISAPRSIVLQSFPKFILRPSISVTLSGKGQELGYSRSALDLIKTIDLSSNDLTGKIPEELGALVLLQMLNLSRNKLQDRIPDMFAGILYLETLDLSFNNLSGVIPESLSRLSFLSHLNLSYNNLSGRIPSSNQLQTLDDPYVYAGNSYLCGPPVSNNCSATAVEDREDMDYGSELACFYVGSVIGFLVGLSSVFVPLLSRKSWRYYYFEIIDKFYHSFRVNQW